MRFTLGTLIGVALGVVTAPIAARTPGLGPAVTEAQTHVLELLRTRAAVSSSAGNIRPANHADHADPANHAEHAAHGSRSDRPPRRAGIVSLAAITAAKSGPESETTGRAKPEAVDPSPTPAPIPSASDQESTAMRLPGDDDVDRYDADTETVADSELDRRAGVLDRLFATYHRVDED